MLHERADFADLLTTVGASTGAGAAIVEKDYWVTQALRAIAAAFPEIAVFKGGTSLSKAWSLVQRFSEDIDLLVRSEGDSLETGGGRDRAMQAIEAAVAEIDGLERQAARSRSERGISRTAVFAYRSEAAALKGLQPTVILEMGIRGGTKPAATRPIRSLIGDALAGTDLRDPSITPFQMTVLDPRRTFVEKLFALHCACELWAEGRTPALQRQGRHLYDIYFLLGNPEVAAFVGGPEYHALIHEIDENGRTYFARDHRVPAEMRFRASRALVPGGELLAALRDEFARSEFLFYGGFPDLDAIYARIDEVRDRL